MSDFKAKMHQIQFRLGLRPRPRWWSLQRSLRFDTFKRREGKGTEGEVGEEGKVRGEDPKSSQPQCPKS